MAYAICKVVNQKQVSIALQTKLYVSWEALTLCGCRNRHQEIEELAACQGNCNDLKDLVLIPLDTDFASVVQL